MSGDLDISAGATVGAVEVTAETCPVCGGRSFAPMFRSRGGARVARRPTHVAYRITHSRRELVRAILRCRECGMAVLPADLRDQADSSYATGEDGAYLQQAEERIRNAHRLLRLVPSGGRLLDVGCACGFLLVAARQRGFAVQGVEPAAWAAGYARERFQLDVWQGSIEDAALAPASYDVAVLADVIEHMTAPRAVLAKLWRLLVPGGRLLILTPDVGSRVARLAGTHWWGLLDDHYHYFDRVTLPQLLAAEGFTTERITAIGREFPVQHWVFKLSQYSRWLHRGAAAVVRLTYMDRLRVHLNFGDQMACVARKPAT